MSTRELERVEVMGRVAKEELKLIDAAAMLRLSYRQIKRLWRRYQQKGSKGLQHGNVGRVSNRSKPAKFRRTWTGCSILHSLRIIRVLRLVRTKARIEC
jgi:Helix-turn-helix domain